MSSLRSSSLHVSAMLIALYTVAVVAITSVYAPQTAHAQSLTMTSGPFVEIADEIVGPYRLIVQQSPERVILGTLSIAVQVHTADGDASVPDAMVRVYGTPSERGARQVAPALNSPADREFYVGRLEVEDTGVWALDVVVEHPDHGSATLTLATEVFDRSRGGSNLLLGTILWVGVSLVFVGVTWYLIRKARRTREEIRQARSSTAF